jgi:hypothetical protein
MNYRAPLDPECPHVEAYMAALFGDPMTPARGAPTDEICEDFARRHRRSCERCRYFGLANIEVEP